MDILRSLKGKETAVGHYEALVLQGPCGVRSAEENLNRSRPLVTGESVVVGVRIVHVVREISVFDVVGGQVPGTKISTLGLV